MEAKGSRLAELLVQASGKGLGSSGASLLDLPASFLRGRAVREAEAVAGLRAPETRQEGLLERCWCGVAAFEAAETGAATAFARAGLGADLPYKSSQTGPAAGRAVERSAAAAAARADSAAAGSPHV